MSEIKDNKDNFENTAFDTEVENLFDEPDASPEEVRDAVLESMDKTKKRVKTAKKIGIAIAVKQSSILTRATIQAMSEQKHKVLLQDFS